MSTPQSSAHVAAACMVKWYQFETLAEKWAELDKKGKYLPKSLPKFLEKVNEGCYLSTVTELRDWWGRLSQDQFIELAEKAAEMGTTTTPEEDSAPTPAKEQQAAAAPSTNVLWFLVCPL